MMRDGAHGIVRCDTDKSQQPSTQKRNAKIQATSSGACNLHINKKDNDAFVQSKPTFQWIESAIRSVALRAPTPHHSFTYTKLRFCFLVHRTRNATAGALYLFFAMITVINARFFFLIQRNTISNEIGWP